MTDLYFLPPGFVMPVTVNASSGYGAPLVARWKAANRFGSWSETEFFRQGDPRIVQAPHAAIETIRAAIGGTYSDEGAKAAAIGAALIAAGFKLR